MKKIKKILLIGIMAVVMLVEPTLAAEKNDIESSSSSKSMSIELVENDKKERNENEEVNIEVNMKDADYITAGILKIKYDSDLKYIGTEEKNNNYTIQEAVNGEQSILVITFSSNEGKSGNIKLCTLKFKVPEKITDKTNFDISFEDETNLVTTNDSTMKYKLVPTTVNCKKTDKSITIYIGIAVGIIVVLILLVVLIKKNKKK